MATGKVARRAVVEDLAAILNSPEVVALIAGLASFRVRRMDRVALHVDLVMLARLGQALAHARVARIPVAA